MTGDDTLPPAEPPEPPPDVEIDEPPRKRDTLGCLTDGCCMVGCLADFLLWATLAAVGAGIARRVRHIRV